uniref:Uncharacterized protein n=1 Tax=Salmonella phage vB_SE130_2P TaxID=3236707 RepID=A0AB39C517_9VIRU
MQENKNEVTRRQRSWCLSQRRKGRSRRGGTNPMITTA